MDQASEAAERLLSDAASRVSRIPPSGWQRPRSGGDTGGGLFDNEVELLLGVLTALRDRIPPELQQRLTEALREVLLALRALIDWYLERTERRAGERTEVQDIPIL